MYLHLIDIDLKYLTSSLHKFGFLTKDWGGGEIPGVVILDT